MSTTIGGALVLNLSWFRPRMYPFYLVRNQDVSGVSGTGIVAYGVVLPSGQAVMEWNSRFKTVTIFSSLDQVRHIHGHGGRTQVMIGLPDQRPWRWGIWLRGPKATEIAIKPPLALPHAEEASVNLLATRRSEWDGNQGLRALVRSRRRDGFIPSA